MTQTKEQTAGAGTLDKRLVTVELEWSPADRTFVFPMPESARLKLLWDDQNGYLKPVPVGEQMLFRERQATAADGTMFRERIIYRDTSQVTPRTVEQQKLINTALRLQWQREVLETLIAFRPLLIVGLFVGLIVLVWNLCLAVAAAGTLIGEQIGLALAELAYYAAWGVGILACGLLLKYAVPLVFRSRTDADVSPTAAGSSGPENNHGVTINVQQGGGQFGSQSEAQNIVNGRKF